MKTKAISKESKAILSIFTKQLLEIINTDKDDSCKVDDIKEHIMLWINANDLHPEEVRSYNKESFS